HFGVPPCTALRISVRLKPVNPGRNDSKLLALALLRVKTPGCLRQRVGARRGSVMSTAKRAIGFLLPILVVGSALALTASSEEIPAGRVSALQGTASVTRVS